MKRRIPRKLKKKLDKMFTPRPVKTRVKAIPLGIGLMEQIRAGNKLSYQMLENMLRDVLFPVDDSKGPRETHKLVFLDDIENEKHAIEYERLNPQPPSIVEIMQPLALAYNVMQMNLESQITKSLKNGSNTLSERSNPGHDLDGNNTSDQETPAPAQAEETSEKTGEQTQSTGKDDSFFENLPGSCSQTFTIKLSDEWTGTNKP
jgi:hypothetical protein